MDNNRSGIIVQPREQTVLIEECDEIWRPVVGFEGRYSVSTSGRVRRERKMGKWPALGLLAPSPNSDGYKSVVLRRSNGRKYHQPVHKLVLLAFIGSPPSGMQARHLDSDRWNARLSNLEWSTQSTNQRDRHSNGTSPRKHGNGCSKIDEQIAGSIRQDWAEGRMTQLEIAAKYNISRSTAQRVIYGVSWAH